MQRMMASLSENLVITSMTSKLIAGTGSDRVVLLVVMTSDRGLCGAFNGSIVREARRLIRQFEAEGKQVKLLCVGRKSATLLRRDHASKIVFAVEAIGKKRVSFLDADKVTEKILAMFEAGEFDICQLVFNRFKSAISQIVTVKQLVPLVIEKTETKEPPKEELQAIYEFEPDEETILAQLLPRNLAMQIYGAMLESAAGEQGARMTAMDNATRNAGDMINKLTLNYNRSRQAYITKELIEIISGAEAV
jgi:F-type H+-transporting ATPase subunit gamma